MDTRLRAAVIDNARWCHLVCAKHGITGRFDPDAWVSSRRTPPGYPDAITLSVDTAPESLLARIDRTADASVKDSFATLDLAAAGFAVLFEAEWIFRPAGSPPVRDELGWERVVRPLDLHDWALDHGGGPDFAAAKLDEPSLSVLAGHDREGRRVAGVIAIVGLTAVGISNAFVVGVADDEPPAVFAHAFAGATAAIVERFPDLPTVGYLAEARLDAARWAGFETVGPLRVWLQRGSVGDTAAA